MPGLREVQDAFRVALLGGSAEPVLALIADDERGRAARFAIYRNNVAVSLADTLAATFPAVQRLVGPRFFAYAAHEFIAAHPPTRGCLAEYGGDFSDFLAAFPACRALAWLADVARLEWLVNRAANAPEAARVAPQDLAGFALQDTPRLVFALEPSLGYLESSWPVERIWRENRAGEGGAVDLAEGGVRLEIGRGGDGVFVRQLDAGSFRFRRALGERLDLEAAASCAVEAAPEFALDHALAELFRDGAVAGISLPPLPYEPRR